MIEDLPTWTIALSHLLTGGLGGVLSSWLASRGSAREGSAALIEARDDSLRQTFDRLDAEIERLDRERRRLQEDLQEERRRCDEQIDALESKVDELEATVDTLVAHYDETDHPLPEEIDP